MNATRPVAFNTARDDGFTLTELLVVMVTVAILSVLLLPAIAGTRPDSQSFQCLENLRQLTLGWQMYAEDNNGALTPNLELGEQPTSWPDPRYLPGGQYAQWCPGNLKQAAFFLYQTNLIEAGLIYPYVNTLNVYKCPADQSAVRFGPLSIPRFRSYSMNCWLAPYPGRDVNSIFGGAQVRIFRRSADFALPGPALTFVFIDENVNTLDDGYFAGSPGLPNQWISIPAARHGGAGSLSYADGHSEMKRWMDKNVLSPPTSGGFPVSDPNSGDNAWLEQRESSLIQ
jgi:prepilin-type processing-associated H-X9-DG protein